MNRGLVGLSVLAVLLFNMVFGIVGVGYAQTPDPVKELLIREINVYRDAITRILDIVSNETQLTTEVRDYLASIENLDLNSLSIDELEQIRDTLKDYFEALKEEVSVDPSIGEEVRQRIMEEVSNVIALILEKYNMTSLNELYDQIRQYIEAGEIDKALEILNELDRVLSEVSVDTHAEEIISEILDMLKSFSMDGNVTSSEALDRSIENIRSAIEVLIDVKNYLESINASEESILAVDLAISTLNSTISILENVKSKVGDVIVPGEMGKAVNSTMTDELLEEIAEYRWKVSALMNESYRLENLTVDMNKTYLLSLIEEARNVLVNASDYLNKSEAAVLNGNLTEAFDYLNRAKVSVEYAEEILEDVADILGTSLKYEDESKEKPLPKLTEKLNDLKEDVAELQLKAEFLLNKTEVQNNNVSLALVQQALEYLNNASTFIDMAWEQLNNGNYTEALRLYNEAYKLYKAAEMNIELVEKTVDDDSTGPRGFMLNRIYEYREEIEELEEKALYLYNIAVEKNNSEAAQLILDAQEKLRNASELLYEASNLIAAGSYDEAAQLLNQIAMLISDARQELIQAANLLNVMGMDDDDMGDDDSDDSKDDDSMGKDGDDDDDDTPGDGRDGGKGPGGPNNPGKGDGEDDEDDEDE